MADINIWYRTDTLLRRRDRSDIIIGSGDGFILGTTIPTSDLCGVLTGVARTTYTGGTSITGSTDSANPTLIESKNIDSLITITSGYVHFLNCYVTASGGTFDTAQVDCRAAGVLRVTFERCTFNPTTPNYWLDNIIGHHMTALRCRFLRGVDAMGSYNTYARRTDNYMLGCLVENTCRFDVDETHSDGTHNDRIQHQGGEGLWVQGNALHGVNLYSNGSSPTGQWAFGNGVLTQENVAIGGVYYLGDIHVTDNWFWGCSQVIRPAARTSSPTTYDAEVKNNTQMDMPYDWGYSLHYYTLRPTSNVTVNGISYPTTGSTDDTNNNKFDTGVDVDSAYRGTAFKVRCDLGG